MKSCGRSKQACRPKAAAAARSTDKGHSGVETDLEAGEQVDYGIVNLRDVVRRAHQEHHRREDALGRGKDLLGGPRGNAPDDLDRLEKGADDVEEAPLPTPEVGKLLILVAYQAEERVGGGYGR